MTACFESPATSRLQRQTGAGWQCEKRFLIIAAGPVLYFRY